MMTTTKRLVIVLLACVTLTHAKGKRGSASNSVSQFNAGSQDVKQRADELDKRNAKLLSIAERVFGDDISEDLLRDLGMFERAIPDPLCTEEQFVQLDCAADGPNRTYVEGTEYPTFNGQCNNVVNYIWGMVMRQHQRLLPHAYENPRWGIRAFSDKPKARQDPDVPLPGPRLISSKVHNTTANKTITSYNHTQLLFYTMQLFDHDVVLTPEGNVRDTFNCCQPVEGVNNFCLAFNITAEEADDTFYEGQCIELRRSDTFLSCGDDTGFQNQYNQISGYVDAGMLYGSSAEESHKLRTHIGGRLKESTEKFPPQANDTDVEDLPCKVEHPYKCMAVGDTRGMVHPALTTLHTVLVREHNRIATAMAAANPTWSDDKVFMETRMIVIAQWQFIVYNEMVPAMLNSSYITANNLSMGTGGYKGYNQSMDASIIQAFSLGYRYHHLMPDSFYKASCPGGVCSNTYTADQSDVYKRPHHVVNESYSAIDGIALGLTHNKCPASNGRVNAAARNKLFYESDHDTLDIAMINIIRGREWGTPAYVLFRELCGFGAATEWSHLLNTHTQDEIDLLASVYLDVRDVDLWTALVTERVADGSLSGPTQSCLVAMQFNRFRHGDRWWFENGFFSDARLQEIKKVTLARILCDNLNVSHMRSDVFNATSNMDECTTIAGMTLSNMW